MSLRAQRDLAVRVEAHLVAFAHGRRLVDGHDAKAAVVQPHETRATLLRTFALATRPAAKASFHTGVLQV